MDLKDCILTRRSVRKFIDKEISNETIEEIVKFASYAPSWKNSQTVRYIAIKDKTLKAKIANECLGGFEWNKTIIDGANVLMVEITVDGICGYNPDGTPTTSKGTHWQSFDAGLNAQTLCLKAHDMGLGSVIMGIYDESKVKEVLNLPNAQSVSSLIALGYHEQKLNAPKRKELNEVLIIK